MKKYQNWGKANRMQKIFAKDNKTVMLAFDHGYFLGPLSGMENPAKVIPPLIPYVDALMMSPGILTSCIEPGVDKAIVLRASGGNSIATEELSNEDLIFEADEAVKLNASAMALSFYAGTVNEKQTLMALAKAINTASKFELPVLAVTAVGRELEKRDARFLALACRIAAEFGADIVKTYYCENFEKVIASCPVPVVVAGGPKLESEGDVMDLVFSAMKYGAAGVDLGRNVWQNENPEIIIQGIQGIVHHHLTSAQALELINDLKAREK